MVPTYLTYLAICISAVIKQRKDGAATAKSSAYAHGTGWRKSRPAGFLGMIASWSQRKMAVESHRKQETARWTSLPDTSGHDELSSGHSCKFHMCNAIRVDPCQETADELGQFSFLEHMEDPRVIDAGMRSSKIRSIEYLINLGHMQHVQGQLSRSRRCCPSFAWKKCTSERDEYTSWCTNEALGKLPW